MADIAVIGFQNPFINEVTPSGINAQLLAAVDHHLHALKQRIFIVAQVLEMVQPITQEDAGDQSEQDDKRRGNQKQTPREITHVTQTEHHRDQAVDELRQDQQAFRQLGRIGF